MLCPLMTITTCRSTEIKVTKPTFQRFYLQMNFIDMTLNLRVVRKSLVALRTFEGFDVEVKVADVS